MTVSGFVLISTAQGFPAPGWLAALDARPARGWRGDQIGPGLYLFRRTERACAYAMAGGDVLIGRLARPLAGGLDSLDYESFVRAARRLQVDTWGEYVFVRRAPVSGDFAVYRDPGGGLEALTWRGTGLSVCASESPVWLDPALPPDLALDWTAIAAMATNPTLQTAGCALTGIHALTPGEAWEGGQAQQLWRPADHVAVWPPRSRSSPVTLAEVVGDAVGRLAEGRVLLEVSGGLDSAIVAGCLPRRRLTAAVNYFVRDRQGDERRFARAVAVRAGTPLTEVEKPEAALDLQVLAEASSGPRPALNSFDHAHDADIAIRCQALGIDTLMTGQGGDDVFFQSPTPLIVADGYRHGIRLDELCGVARWQSRSVYGLLWAGAAAALRGPDFAPRRPAHATAQAWAAVAKAPPHPWLAGLEAAPSGKVMQVAGLANALIVKGASRRGEVAALRHPLLAQPVVEYCLGVSTPDLTRGRDRGLARLAFADVAPAAIIERVTKGRMSAHYGRVLAAALGEIRPLLLEGQLAGAGVVDTTVLDKALTPEALIWRAGYGAIINLLMLELWVCGWTERWARHGRVGDLA